MGDGSGGDCNNMSAVGRSVGGRWNEKMRKAEILLTIHKIDVSGRSFLLPRLLTQFQLSSWGHFWVPSTG